MIDLQDQKKNYLSHTESLINFHFEIENEIMKIVQTFWMVKNKNISFIMTQGL